MMNEEGPRLFVAGQKAPSVDLIRDDLRKEGFLVQDYAFLAPGEDRRAPLLTADLVLFVFEEAPKGQTFDGFLGPSSRELSLWRIEHGRGRLPAIPILIGRVNEDDLPLGIAEIQPIHLPTAGATHVLAQELRRLPIFSRPTALKAKGRKVAPGSMLRLKSLSLTDIGCFEALSVPLGVSWCTVLGDNATGKSTLLRSLALGLCRESDAAALIKTLPGPVRRYGAENGEIRVELEDYETGAKFAIHTSFLEGSAGDEIVRKRTEPEAFPWDRLFVCGYGTNRTRQATASYDEYSTLLAVRPLFDDSVQLQNPELVLLRQENGLRRRLEERLLRILMLDGKAQFVYSGKGPAIQGKWGEQPIQSLSDGYRSTLQWVLDFCAWAVQAERFETGNIGGILLIDELEQHLHPRWQRFIVQLLRAQFPDTQILATTHTPLTASGVADIDSSQLVRLRENSEGKIEALVIAPSTLSGKRADQVLTSEAFGLVTTRSPRSERRLDRFAALLGVQARSDEEEAELAALRVELEDALSLGETAAERRAEKIVERVLQEMTGEIEPELLDFETRQLLQDLFRTENAG